MRSDFLLESGVWKGEEGEPHVEKPDKHDLSQVTKVNNSPQEPCWQYVLGYDVIKMPFSLWSSPPNAKSQPNHEKNIRQFQGQTFYNTRRALLRTAQVTRNAGSLRNCHSQEQPKEPWQLHAMPQLERDPGTEEVLSKTGGRPKASVCSEQHVSTPVPQWSQAGRDSVGSP